MNMFCEIKCFLLASSVFSRMIHRTLLSEVVASPRFRKPLFTENLDLMEQFYGGIFHGTIFKSHFNKLPHGF